MVYVHYASSMQIIFDMIITGLETCYDKVLVIVGMFA